MINIAELLKDCPKGMELDCTIFEKPVKYIGLTMNGAYIITVKSSSGEFFHLTKEGYLFDTAGSKCLIFPKGKTTWEGFLPPSKFKDGDILSYQCGGFKNRTIYIYRYHKTLNTTYYVALSGDIDSTFMVNHIEGCALNGYNDTVRFATEEEKQKLFDAIKAKSYKWNAETKTLEKVIVPKFKAGDYVTKKGGIIVPVLITSVSDEYYYSNTGNTVGYFSVNEQDDWELAPNKFDITTLKPFDKVLVRTDKFTPVWTIAFFDGYQPNIGGSFRSFGVSGGEYFQQCIPYEGNEHLRGTTNDCDDFYKIW